jgi:mono/diheme cytochrome c family protein
MKRGGTGWVDWLLIMLLAGCSMTAPPTPPIAAPAPTTTPATTSTPTSTAQPTPSEAEIAQGIQIYKAAYCGACHALDAADTGGIFGPTHNDMAATAAARIMHEDYTGAATMPGEYLRESILNPGVYIVDGYAATRHPMPAYTYLPAEEIEALVYLLLQQ